MWLLIDIRVDFDICRYVDISSYLQIIILLDVSITFLVDIFASTERKGTYLPKILWTVLLNLSAYVH